MQNVWQQLWPEVTYTTNLYLASPSGIVGELSRLSDQFSGAMMIGHNPGISELACWLAQENIEMPTAALVVLSGAGSTWAGALERSPWRLEGLYFPKKLGFS
jgi:phosphohistidine phosphatase